MKIRVDKYSAFFIFILLFPHFKPGLFEYYSGIDTIYNVFRVLSTIMIVWLLIGSNEYSKVSEKSDYSIITILIMYYIVFLFSTFSNDVEMHNIILRIFQQLPVFLIILYYSRICFFELVCALFWHTEILSLVNFMTIIEFPKTMRSDSVIVDGIWFLGFKNSYMTYYLVFFVATFLYMRLTKEYAKGIFFIIIMTLSLLLAKSATTTVCLILFLLLSLLCVFDGGKIINSLVLSIVNMVIISVIMVFGKISVFGSFIQNVLKKDLSLSGRVGFWNDVMRRIPEKLWLGYGTIFYNDSRAFWGRNWTTHTHNLILENLFEGGVVGLSLYIIFNILILMRLYKYKSSYFAQILSIAIFVLNIGGIVEYYYKGILFIVYAFAWCIPYICSSDVYFEIEKE